MKTIDLTTHSSRKSPFKVPENYFEDFTAQMVSRLPEATGDDADTTKARPVIMVTTTDTDRTAAAAPQAQPAARVSLFDRVKPYLYLAATICGLAFGVHVIGYQQQLASQKTPAVATLTPEQADAYVDNVYDYVMMDDHDVFACATGNF